MIYEKWGYPIFRCNVCRLGSTDVGAGFDVASIYSEDYFQGGCKDGYVDYLKSEAVLRKEFRRTLHQLCAHGLQSGHLLEVGSAYGFFLLEAQEYFQCTGIEISETAVQSCHSRGLDVHCGVVDRNFLREHGPFDAIAMLDVIEHLQNPAETLSLLYEALAKNGSIVISTGDWNSLPARIMGRHWRLMTPPQHLFYFPRRTLVALLEKIGFEVVHSSRPWKLVPLGLAAYQLGNRLGWRLPTLELLNSLAVPLNLFDTMQLIARKG